MHIIISPAKNLKNRFPEKVKTLTYPEYLNESNKLMKVLTRKNSGDLMKLMKINAKLAELNYQRYKKWSSDHNEQNTGPAVFLFNGDVYQGLKADTLSEKEVNYAQNHLSILSGLYGILRPLDGIMPYRLEMGTKLVIKKHKDLYQFWDDKINKLLKMRMQISGDNVLVNLASKEYFKAVVSNKLKCRVITPVFKDFRNGEYKLISVYFKKARGLMTRFIIKNQLVDPDELKLFDFEGYYFNDNLSEGDKLVFVRD
ncbi:peroxide stress protein YaaA [Bacteroidota bacterium]